jgi:phosphoglycolate phosphatase-like HAD superfamily hydrolase
MAKDIKDIEFDFERTIAAALHCAMDDAAAAKIDAEDTKVSILRVLAHSLCSIAYIGGMDKEAFLEATGASWDTTRQLADEAAEKVQQYIDRYNQVYKEVLGQDEIPPNPTPKEPLKN